MPDEKEVSGVAADVQEDSKDVSPEEALLKKTDEEVEDDVRKSDQELLDKYDITIDDLIVSGYVAHDIKIGEKHGATIRTLTADEDKELGRRLGEYSGTRSYVLARNSDDILEYALLRFDNHEFGDKNEEADRKAKLEFIGGQSVAIKILLAQEFSQLTKALAILLRGPGAQNPLVAPLAGIGLS